MHRWAAIALLVGYSWAAWAQVPAALTQDAECAHHPDPKTCEVSRPDLKKARRAFERGLHLRAGNETAAFGAFEEAARLVPRNLEYVSAREIARQQLVLEHLNQGNQLMAERKQTEAAAEFRQAVNLDPDNQFARQRLLDAASAAAPPRSAAFRVLSQSQEIHLAPAPGKQNFHLRTDTRGLISDIATAFKLHARFDESVPTRPVRFDLEDADFYTAMRAAGLVTKTFWVPFAADEFLVAADTTQLHQELDRMVLRTFYLPDASSAQDVTEIVNSLRTLFEIRFIVPQPSNFTVTVRAPQPIMDAATSFLESLDGGRPQVMLDIQVFDVNESMMRTIGLDLPTQFQAFNVGAAALALLQNPNIQALINQLIASGGINQANSQTLAALLSQLQNQQQNSLLKQPFATFGGGKTLFAVPIPPATANFSLNQSRVTSLQNVTLRASQGNAATLLIGERYPILNATFAPIFNTPALAQVLQNGSFSAPFPSFTYEDLGITVKATPQINSDEAVTLNIEVAMKALTGQSLNGVPVLSNRDYTGFITLKDGEAGVMAGMLDKTDTDTLTGIPGLVHVPGLSYLLSNRGKQYDIGELLVMITPHIVRMRPSGPRQEIWMGSR